MRPTELQFSSERDNSSLGRLSSRGRPRKLGRWCELRAGGRRLLVGVPHPAAAQFRPWVGVVVAKSVDGVNFKPVCEVSREAFGAASLERPVIMPTDVGWRLYLSCATPNSKHWWMDALDAERPRGVAVR